MHVFKHALHIFRCLADGTGGNEKITHVSWHSNRLPLMRTLRTHMADVHIASRVQDQRTVPPLGTVLPSILRTASLARLAAWQPDKSVVTVRTNLWSHPGEKAVTLWTICGHTFAKLAVTSRTHDLHIWDKERSHPSNFGGHIPEKGPSHFGEISGYTSDTFAIILFDNRRSHQQFRRSSRPMTNSSWVELERGTTVLR